MSVLANIATKVLQRFDYPIPALLTKLQSTTSSENLLNETIVLNKTREIIATVNTGHRMWQSVLACSDLELTAKTALTLLTVAFIFQRITLTTLLFVMFFSAMTGPQIYKVNEKKIDDTIKQQTETAMTKANEVMELSRAQMLIMQEKLMLQLGELKVKMIAMLQELSTKLPPQFGDKLRSMLPASEAKTEKMD